MIKRIAGCAALITLFVAAPALASPDLYGVTTQGALVRFNPANPTEATTVAQVSGLAGGESIAALAWPYDPVDVPRNPAIDELLGVSTQSRVYAIDPASGAAQTGGGPLSPPLDPSELSLAAGTDVTAGYVGALGGHVVSTLSRVTAPPPPLGSQGRRSTPPAWQNNGSSALSYPYGDPAYGSDPNISGAAYRLVPPQPSGTVNVLLYALDATRATLLKANGFPDLHTVGPLGIPIQVPAPLAIAVDGTAVLATHSSGSGTDTSTLYRVDLSSGAASPIGSLPAGVVLRSMVFVPPPFVSVYPTQTYLPAAADLAVERLGDPAPPVSFHYDATSCAQPQCQQYPPDVSHNWLPSTGTVNLAPGQETTSIAIPTRDAELPFDSVLVKLDQALGATLQTSTSVALIVDPGPEFATPTVSVDSGQGSATVTVTRVAVQQPAVVQYSAGAGDARSGVDYVPVRGTLSFGAGQQSATFAVPLGRGSDDGATRTVALAVSAALASPDGEAAVNRDQALLLIHHARAHGVAMKARILSYRVHPRSVVVYFSCSQACQAQVTLATPGRRHPAPPGHALARMRTRASAQRRTRVVLRLGTAARRGASRPPRRAVLILSATDVYGHRVITRRAVTLNR